MSDHPPPPYEYPGYQGPATAPPPPPPPPDSYPPQGYPGYGTGEQAGGYPPYPGQGYTDQQGYPEQGYPEQGYPGYSDKERAPLVGPGTTTIIIPSQCIVWGRYPVQTTCGNCHNAILTEVQFVTGTFTWLIAGIILLIGGWLLCCLIPFFADSCKDVRHRCPSCKAIIHTWTRI